MELAGPHTQNGRALRCATVPTTMRQTNPRISLSADLPGLEVQVAVNLAENRVEWKRNRPSSVANLITGLYSKHYVVTGAGFSHCTRGSDDSFTAHKFETEGRLVKRKETKLSCLPRGLANNVEPQRSLCVESPIGRVVGRKEGVRSII